MNYWLIKSEPGTWSWQDQLAAKNKTTEWDGVRNAQVTINMRAMKKGDQAFFYHSVSDKAIIGVVEITKTFYPDPADDGGRFGMVDVKAIETLPTPVTLAEIKADDRLKDLLLVRNSRLSVSPIDAKSWKIIRKMGGL